MDSPWFNEERDQEWSMTSDVLWDRVQYHAVTCDELERVCRGLTDIIDAVREADRDLFDRVIAPMIEGDNDPRPEWWLEKEYCPRRI